MIADLWHQHHCETLRYNSGPSAPAELSLLSFAQTALHNGAQYAVALQRRHDPNWMCLQLTLSCCCSCRPSIVEIIGVVPLSGKHQAVRSLHHAGRHGGVAEVVAEDGWRAHLPRHARVWHGARICALAFHHCLCCGSHGAAPDDPAASVPAVLCDEMARSWLFMHTTVGMAT